MPHPRRRAAIVAAVIAAIGWASVALSAEPSPSPTPPPSAAALPSADALPSPSPDSGGRHAAPELEDILPASLGGISLTRESQDGVDLSTASAAFDTFLSNLGRSIEDFSLASSYSRSGDVEAQVGAWRVLGADPATLLPEYIAAIQASSSVPITIETTTIAEHEVTQIGAPGELTQGPIYVFVRDDTLLFVQTPEPALAEEAIGKLPE